MKKLITVSALILGFILGFLFSEALQRLPSKWSYDRFSRYDIDGNGSVDSADAKVVFDVAAGTIVATPEKVTQCDFDKDGFVTEEDAEFLYQLVVTR